MIGVDSVTSTDRLFLEEWKDIENFTNYSISTLGRVKNNTTGKILKPFASTSGVMQVDLNGKTKKIHLLVANAFIPNPEKKPIAEHIDKNKENNRVDNLRWITYIEHRANSNAGIPKTPILATKGGKEYIFSSQNECARVLGLHVAHINACLKGRLKTHNGYTFEYLEGRVACD